MNHPEDEKLYHELERDSVDEVNVQEILTYISMFQSLARCTDKPWYGLLEDGTLEKALKKIEGVGKTTITYFCVGEAKQMINKKDIGVLKEFYHLAKSFCSLLENETLNYITLDLYMEKLFELMLLGIRLDNTDEFVGEDINDEIQHIDHQLDVKVDFENYFDMSFNPFDKDSVVTCSFTDCLGDIYNDLMCGIRLYERQYYEDAAWQWSFDYCYHWGKHALEVLWVLYHIRDEHRYD